MVCRRLEELPHPRSGRFRTFSANPRRAGRGLMRDIRLLSSRPFPFLGTAEHREAGRQAVSLILANYHRSVALPELLRHTSKSRATFVRQCWHHTRRSFFTLPQSAPPAGCLSFPPRHHRSRVGQQRARPQLQSTLLLHPTFPPLIKHQSDRLSRRKTRQFIPARAQAITPAGPASQKLMKRETAGCADSIRI